MKAIFEFVEKNKNIDEAVQKMDDNTVRSFLKQLGQKIGRGRNAESNRKNLLIGCLYNVRARI